HLLAGRRAHPPRARLGEIEEIAQAAELVHEAARHPQIEELRDPIGQIVEALDPEPRGHALAGAEGVDQDRRGETLDVLEEERGVAPGRPLADTVDDLRDLEVARYGSAHSAELTVLFQVGDELAKIGERHGPLALTRWRSTARKARAACAH